MTTQESLNVYLKTIDLLQRLATCEHQKLMHTTNYVFCHYQMFYYETVILIISETFC